MSRLLKSNKRQQFNNDSGKDVDLENIERMNVFNGKYFVLGRITFSF